MNRAFYAESINTFLKEDFNSIYGKISGNYKLHQLDIQQSNAWKEQIKILKNQLKGLDGHIYFEFGIPRMGKRVDNILIIKDFIFVLEFKVGDKLYHKHALDQVVDYCLDLKNFHEGSHDKKLIPILVSTKAEDFQNNLVHENNIFDPLKVNETSLKETIKYSLHLSDSVDINASIWESTIYKPTPTIIEAAQALYKGHNVEEISRNDAGAINLSKTTECINNIIDNSKKNKIKSICFLTGVPGAGKTLAGLNIANQRRKNDEDEHAVFLSGNGPLVEVLREALTRDKVSTAKESGEKVTKKEASRETHSFIQNIHHFRDDNLDSENAPIEKVVVFDEAQRAWALEQVSSFMKRKKGRDNFKMSEPEYLISVMDRHLGWCTIICLIGGGQEINTGEAGVSEWLSSLKDNYPEWDIYYSNLISSDINYLSNLELRDWLQKVGNEKHELHLSVSVRSFRSEKISELMHEILEGQIIRAKIINSKVKNDFPIFLTRDFSKAKDWLRKQAKGTERIGLVASSGGRRLRPIGIEVKNELSASNWFLNDADDVRSSNYLEEVATEFDIQGLEIDWVCLAWDINYYFENNKWNCQNFSGTKWQNIHNDSQRSYLQNAYRVLLTRARQGLIIFIPFGDDLDKTRPKKLYDSTYKFFLDCGFPEV